MFHFVADFFEIVILDRAARAVCHDGEKRGAELVRELQEGDGAACNADRTGRIHVFLGQRHTDFDGVRQISGNVFLMIPELGLWGCAMS